MIAKRAFIFYCHPSTSFTIIFGFLFYLSILSKDTISIHQLLSNELKGYEKMVSDLEDNGAHLRNLKQYDQRLLAARVKDRELNDSFLKKAKLALLEKEKSLGHSITENRREQIDRSLASGVVAQATPRFPSELGLAYYFLYFRFESVRSRLRLME